MTVGIVMCHGCGHPQSCNPSGKMRKHKDPRSGERCGAVGEMHDPARVPPRRTPDQPARYRAAAPIKYRVVLPNGSVVERKSRRIYTHALVKKLAQGWVCTAFCGSFDLAVKERDTQRSLEHRQSERATEWAILPVRGAS